MDRSLPLPKLRALDIIPIGERENMQFVVRDPTLISSSTISVTVEAFFIMSLLNGKNTLTDIQAAFFRRFGRILYTEEVEQLLKTLDELLFLENDRFQNAKQQIENDFRASPVRLPFSAGSGYPASGDKLRELIDFILKSAVPKEIVGKPRALVAPHIDLERGKSGYAAAYQAIRKIEPKTFVILGTNHHGLGSVCILTRKNFATPFGIAKTDREIVDAIANRIGEKAFEHESDHRTEHSIELQVIFLQHLFGPEVKIAPVLCGLPDETAPDPMTNKEYQHLIESLSNLIVEKRDSLFVIAAADLAHIGPQFGSPQLLDELQLLQSRQKDQQMLDALISNDPSAFFRYVAQEQNSRHVCGLAPIDIISRILPETNRFILHYEQWYDKRGMSSVSFASVLFTS